MVDSCVPLGDLSVLFSLAIAMMFSIISFFLMLGRAIPRSPWEALARNEFRQVIISAVLGVVLIGLASTACSMSKVALAEVVKSPFTDQFRHSSDYLNYLNGIGYNTLKNYWVLTYTLNAVTATARWGDVRYLGIASIVSKLIERGLSLIVTVFMASLTVQLISIQAAQAFAFTMILPIGMVLRAIPLTREGGSFLIALAFGLYVVWPFTYVANYEVSKAVWRDTDFNKLIGTPDIAQLNYPSLAKVWSILSEFANIVSLLMPQAIALPMISMTLLISFVRMFSMYLNNLA
jgi:hypothetical protein